MAPPPGERRPFSRPPAFIISFYIIYCWPTLVAATRHRFDAVLRATVSFCFVAEPLATSAALLPVVAIRSLAALGLSEFSTVKSYTTVVAAFSRDVIEPLFLRSEGLPAPGLWS